LGQTNFRIQDAEEEKGQFVAHSAPSSQVFQARTGRTGVLALFELKVQNSKTTILNFELSQSNQKIQV
jgi:hypothetical protein